MTTTNFPIAFTEHELDQIFEKLQAHPYLSTKFEARHAAVRGRLMMATNFIIMELFLMIEFKLGRF